MQTYAAPRDPTAVMGKRIVAYIIDAILVLVVYIVMFVALGDSINTGGFDPCGREGSPTLCFHGGDTTLFAEGGDAAAISLVPLLYWLATAVFLQGATGSTPGKAILGLKTIRRDTGAICGIGKAFVRSLLWIVDAFPYCFPLVGLITSLASDGHKRVGDMAAGTAVVNKSDVGVPLDGGPAYQPGQQWAAPVVAGYAPPPPGGYAPPPPGGGYAPPPPAGDFTQQPVGDFSQEPAADFAQQPVSDFTQPPVDDFGQPPADDFGQPAIEDFAAPDPGTAADFPAPDPAATYETPAPIPPVEEPPMVQSTQPPATSEPQWDAARNTYIQWDPVLAAWMQWDEPAQRWKNIDT